MQNNGNTSKQIQKMDILHLTDGMLNPNRLLI